MEENKNDGNIKSENESLKEAFKEILQLQQQYIQIFRRIAVLGDLKNEKELIGDLMVQLQETICYCEKMKKILCGGGGLLWIEIGIGHLIDEVNTKIESGAEVKQEILALVTYLEKSVCGIEEMLLLGLYNINLGDIHYKDGVNVCDISSMEEALLAMEEETMNPLEHFYYREPHRKLVKWSHYFEVYHTHLQKFRNRPVTILEIGVFGGGSLQMWKQYFGAECRCVGVDILEECKNYEEEQIKIYIGSQENRDFLRQIAQELDTIDIVIDDGGHFMNQQTVTFEELFPRLADGGVYICEDVHTSYWEDYGGGYREEKSFINYSKNFIDYLNARYSTEKALSVNEWTRTIGAIHYYDSMVVLEKKDHKPSIPFWMN